ncbi:MAG: hydrolase [Firmicutes bacterium]|nr:hydrolase [Bacillota bacterium]
MSGAAGGKHGASGTIEGGAGAPGKNGTARLNDPWSMSRDVCRREGTALSVIDVQERLLPQITGAEAVVGNALKLIDMAAILQIPIIVTEQYPRGLGPTVAPVLERLFGDSGVVSGVTGPPIEKVSFSCFGSPAYRDKLKEVGAKRLVLCGVEAHVCVCQTALDALAAGLQVHVVVDSVGSRRPSDAEVALGRLGRAGAVLTCTESVIYELLQSSDVPEFKQVLEVVKRPR